MPFTIRKMNEILSQFENTYVGLHTGEPKEENEIKEKGYFRKPSKLEIIGTNQVSNSENIIFDTAQSNYGVITHIAIYDKEEDGDMIYWIRANQAREVKNFEDYRISKDNLIIQIVV